MRFNESRASLVLAIVSFVWLVGYFIGLLWPASYWMEIKSIKVKDADAGRPVLMYVDRDIRRDVSANWSVSVREISKSGGIRLACSAGQLSDYKTTAKLPDVLTLGWWTNGRCETLPAGHYIVNTTWAINAPYLPDKVIERQSNIFEVRP